MSLSSRRRRARLRKGRWLMVLGHVETTPHGGTLAVLVRVGPLLPLALVVAWAALVRVRRLDRAGSLAAGAALALGAAGAIHLALAPEHIEEGLGPGAFFVAAGAAQLALAGLVATRRGAGPRSAPWLASPPGSSSSTPPPGPCPFPGSTGRPSRSPPPPSASSWWRPSCWPTLT